MHSLEPRHKPWPKAGSVRGRVHLPQLHGDHWCCWCGFHTDEDKWAFTHNYRNGDHENLVDPLEPSEFGPLPLDASVRSDVHRCGSCGVTYGSAILAPGERCDVRHYVGPA